LQEIGAYGRDKKSVGGKGMKSDLVKVSITVNKKAWKESKGILRDIGISRSSFINVTLTQLLRESKGLVNRDDRMSDVVGSLFELSKAGRKKRK
jgi:hypothetical protein